MIPRRRVTWGQEITTTTTKNQKAVESLTTARNAKGTKTSQAKKAAAITDVEFVAPLSGSTGRRQRTRRLSASTPCACTPEAPPRARTLGRLGGCPWAWSPRAEKGRATQLAKLLGVASTRCGPRSPPTSPHLPNSGTPHGLPVAGSRETPGSPAHRRDSERLSRVDVAAPHVNPPGTLAPVLSQPSGRPPACVAPPGGTVSFPDNDVTFLADD
jgi:hypothetical protein